MSETVDGLLSELADMRIALESRTTIAQATGILAARFAIPTVQAWSLLRETSNRSNRKLAEIARVVVDTHDRVPIVEESEIRVAVAFAGVLDVSLRRVCDRSGPVDADHRDQ